MTITIQSTGQEYETEDGELILDAGLRHGVNLVYGCRSGKCGECLSGLISGEVYYPNGQPVALSDDDIANGKAIICQACAKGDVTLDAKIIESEAVIASKKMPARVSELTKLSHDVIRLKLKIPSTDRMQFLAGQYVDFILKDGRRRAFSLANPPHDDEFLEFHIRHVPGGYFTSIVFDELEEKALIRIEGPLGTFFLRENSDAPIIMVAGGTGFAPMQGMLLHAIQIGLNRPIHLFWGVRAKRDLYLHEEAVQWSKEFDQFKYTPVLSEPEEDDNWDGDTGWVHEVVAKTYPDMSNYEVYMSGPPPMIYAAKDAFVAQGLPEDKIYSDSFDFADDPDVTAEEKESTSN